MAEWAPPPPLPSGRPPTPPLAIPTPVDEEYNPPFAPATLVVQVPKDAIYRVPPPENARIVEQHRNNLLNRHNQRNPCLSCLRRSLVPLIIIFGLLFIIGIIVYLVFRPVAPTFTVEHVLVHSRRPGKPEFDFIMSSRNPGGRLDFAFQSGGKAEVSYKNKNVAAGGTPEFTLNGEHRAEFKMALHGRSLPEEVEKSLKAASKAVIPLSLRANFSVKLRLGGLAVWTMSVDVECDVRASHLGKEGHVVSQKCTATLN